MLKLDANERTMIHCLGSLLAKSMTTYSRSDTTDQQIQLGTLYGEFRTIAYTLSLIVSI
jgi:hypothetical protein